MTKIYSLNDHNTVNYEILENFVIIKFINFDNVETIFECMKSYFEYFSTLDEVDFLCSYPGTCNPIVFEAGLRVIKNHNFNYRIFYNELEVKDLFEFEKNILNKHVDLCMNYIKNNKPADKQSSCDGLIGKTANENGFNKCAIFSPLKKNYDYVKTPIRYYKKDKENFLIEEYEEKPNDFENFYQSIRLKDKFKKYLIRLEKGKPVYYEKN